MKSRRVGLTPTPGPRTWRWSPRHPPVEGNRLSVHRKDWEEVQKWKPIASPQTLRHPRHCISRQLSWASTGGRGACGPADPLLTHHVSTGRPTSPAWQEGPVWASPRATAPQGPPAGHSRLSCCRAPAGRAWARRPSPVCCPARLYGAANYYRSCAD